MVFKVGDKVKLNELGRSKGFVLVTPETIYTIASVIEGVVYVTGVEHPYYSDNWELVKTEMKYKVGDKVRIVGNNTNHGFNINDIVIIEEIRDVGEKGGVYVASCFDHPGEEWYVTESDVGFFMDLKLQTPMDVVDKYYENLVKDSLKDDPVESPSHYSSDKIECVDYLKDNMPFEAYLGGLEWNVKKYLHRWRRKGKPVEDLKKARWYLDRLINELGD